MGWCDSQETGGGKCEKNGAGYEVVCVTCQRAGRKTCYCGESGKNGYTRGGEHRAACRLKNEENALYKHCLLEHGGMQAEFSMKVSYQMVISGLSVGYQWVIRGLSE